MDDRAWDLLSSSSEGAIEKVIREFRPRSEGDADYSAIVTKFTKQCQLNVQSETKKPPWLALAAQTVKPSRKPSRERERDRHRDHDRHRNESSGDAALRKFKRQYPMDDRAFEFLASSTSQVQEKIISTFRPSKPDDTDYSAAITAYVRTCRRDQRADGRADGRAEARVEAAPTTGSRSLRSFRERYPMDDRAYDYLTSSPPEVVDAVLQQFQPRAEGEQDYSAVVTSFTKRCRLGGANAAPGKWRKS